MRIDCSVSLDRATNVTHWWQIKPNMRHILIFEDAAVRCHNLHGHRNDWISLRRQDCWGILNAEVLGSLWGPCWTERKSGTAEASLLGSSVPKADVLTGGRKTLVGQTLSPHALLTYPCTRQKEDTEGGVLGVCFSLEERKHQRQLPSVVKVCAINC